MSGLHVRFPRALVPLLLALATALAAGGCGSGGGDELDGSHPDYEKALAGAPAPLAALHAQGNELLPGGIDAYEERIASLRGYPVVVNVWASWCGPCRFEFPTFQRLSARLGKQVAFLGVDSQDSDDGAEAFLSEAPVPYPSYTDPDKEIAGSLDAVPYPSTAFYNREGSLAFVRKGPYSDPAELRADVERCAFGRPPGCESG